MKWNPFGSVFHHQTDAGQSQQESLVAKGKPGALPELGYEPSAADQTFVSRQPIMDEMEKVTGFHLRIRPIASLPESAPSTPGESTRLVIDILNTFNASTILGDRQGWINFPEHSIQSDLVQILPRANFVIEYSQDSLDEEETVKHCGRLLQRGYFLAVNCKQPDFDFSILPSVANRVIYDLAQQDLQTIARLDRVIKPYGLKRLIRNVNNRDTFESCKSLGFDLYQGIFFQNPQTVASQRLDPSRARVIEIFNLVMKKADVDVIEDAFKHDVALCYSLLCYINSVGIGMQYKVSSIRNAIMLMGYDFLWRWLSLLIYAGIDLSAAQRALLNTAIIRGRLTELLGQNHLSAKDANALFVVGNFSLLDTLLGIPMEQVLERIKLPEDIQSALLKGEGKYGPYLKLARAFESSEDHFATQLCKQLDIKLLDATQAHFAAIEWARMVAK